ncbi:MAG: ribonuclease P protein component [Rhodospirillales bacterium CG15_BIG_FIL_POST_REV_8_21_14_020_66_15]|nr:MAG: ribonuclease P protein component [Rhodospirillales bacterium CG15_BIG_FIL_POST_REV_8_21_14_020_66_15]
MSPTVSRLKRRADFLKVARKGRKWAAPGLVLQAFDRTGDGDAAGPGVRAGFTVTRKVGNAVVRNRARRRLRAAAEQVLPDCGTAGYDYVLIGRQGTLERAFPALIGDLRTALERVAARNNGGGSGRRGRDRRENAES